MFTVVIHCKKKDGDWYIYLQCFAHKNSKRAYKNSQKNRKSFKFDKSNAVSAGMTAIKPYLYICLVGSVWFARYCGKMYNRHLFSDGGFLKGTFDFFRLSPDLSCDFSCSVARHIDAGILQCSGSICPVFRLEFLPIALVSFASRHSAVLSQAFYSL